MFCLQNILQLLHRRLFFSTPASSHACSEFATRHRQSITIWSQSGPVSRSNNRFRLQHSNFKCNQDWFLSTTLHLQEKLNTIHPHLQVIFWSVLWSKPSHFIQKEHVDYMALHFPVFSGIVSFDDKTTLDIREGNERKRIRIL